MKVWIDFSNSPHPLLFEPIVDILERHGHSVMITARDNAQTVELARQRYPRVEVVGRRSPSHVGQKGFAIVARVRELREWAAVERPDVAVSHNSYAQIVAARSRGVPVVTAMDYEHQPANHLAFRLASRVLLPDAFPMSAARKQGASEGKVIQYRGFKEDVYVANFEPDPTIFDSVGIRDSKEKVIVVMRAPPTGALYHRSDNNLFHDVLCDLGTREDVWCIVLCRQAEQRQRIREYGLRRVIIPEEAIDGRSLLYFSDQVIGAGGTMTREAAILGTPTVTIYKGRRSAIEQRLETMGLLRELASPADLGQLSKTKTRRPLDEIRARGRNLASMFVDVVVEAAGGSPRVASADGERAVP
jgi:predicted glycosyltransferase